MCKKNSKTMKLVLMNETESTHKVTLSAIKKYEEYHKMGFEKLIDEALYEQSIKVPEHQLKLYDRLMEFREYLCKEMSLNTVKMYMTKIKTAYRKCRVTIPYLPALNDKLCKQHDYITMHDLLTKDEIRLAMDHLHIRMKARVMAMVSGGLSNEECTVLKTRDFIDEMYCYHQCDDDYHALKYLADENHNHIWITNIIRQKTKKPYYAVFSPECVQMMAQAKLYELPNPRSDKLLTNAKGSFAKKLRELNELLGFGKAGGKTRLRPHMLRKFHATYISGSVLNYEEHSLITSAEIDELQGRGKTKTQDTYMKTNPIRQKVLYAKVMNNVSLYHEYEYKIVDGDVEVWVKENKEDVEKLAYENYKLQEQIEKNKMNYDRVNKLRDELGDDMFKSIIADILNGSES